MTTTSNPTVDTSVLTLKISSTAASTGGLRIILLTISWRVDSILIPIGIMSSWRLRIAKWPLVHFPHFWLGWGFWSVSGMVVRTWWACGDERWSSCLLFSGGLLCMVRVAVGGVTEDHLLVWRGDCRSRIFCDVGEIQNWGFYENNFPVTSILLALVWERCLISPSDWTFFKPDVGGDKIHHVTKPCDNSMWSKVMTLSGIYIFSVITRVTPSDKARVISTWLCIQVIPHIKSSESHMLELV